MSKRSRIQDEDGITFIIGNVKNGAQLPYSLRTFGKSTHFDQDTDSIIYGLYLTEGLGKQQQVHNYALYVFNNGNLIFSTMLAPKEQAVDTVEYVDRRYRVYETHQLITERSDVLTVFGLYIQLINTDTSSSLASPHICPMVDMPLWWFDNNMGKDRYKDTIFFPYDIDPAVYGLKIDMRTIPQRTPLWFKARGEVSGTKAYLFIGFFVPTEKEDPGWTIDGGGTVPIDAFQRSRMRFGSMGEEEASILYMLHRPQVRINMVGWCNVPTYMKLPSNWGCSPDGTIFDPSMSATKIPEFIWDLMSEQEKTWDFKRGALEIKSSKNSLKFNAYYLPQVYMEMICTETVWCDLVRYTRKRITDMNGCWVTRHVARVYRIFRHKPTEEKLIQLWKYAVKNKKRLREVVFTDPAFVQFRQYLHDMADTLPYTEISSTPDMLPVFESYTNYKSQFYEKDRIKLHKKLHDAEPALKVRNVPKKKDTEFQQARTMLDAMEADKDDPKKLVRAISSQIRFYSAWLDSLV